MCISVVESLRDLALNMSPLPVVIQAIGPKNFKPDNLINPQFPIVADMRHSYLLPSRYDMIYWCYSRLVIFLKYFALKTLRSTNEETDV